MSNLSHNLTASASNSPDAVAIRLDDHALTYRDLDDATARAAGLLLSHGVRVGDRIGLMLPNIPAFAVIYYAALRIGAVVVPMNPLLKNREVAYYLSDSGAMLLFGWHEMADEAEPATLDVGATWAPVRPGEFEQLIASHEPHLPVEPRDSDDTAVILYTSGTTGQPKGAELTHGSLDRNRRVTAETLLTVTDADVIMGCLPLFHVFGMTVGLNLSVAAGACLTLIPRFDPAKALEVIERDHVTVFEGVPTMYAAMLSVPDHERFDVGTLRTCASGGAALPLEVIRRFEDTFGCAILEGYGLSETSPVASFNHPHLPRKAGSIGTPIDGVEMRIVDDGGNPVGSDVVGEIEIRGHNVMKGYWGKPEETAAVIHDGWFRTGDLARTDEDGYYFIVDRKKDLIIRGGYNVYPREVEEVLYEHPDVTEAAVIGIPEPDLGEEIGAAVAVREGATVTPAELRSFVQERLAAYKYPRHVWILDSLPKGPTGKILRREVSAPALETAR